MQERRLTLIKRFAEFQPKDRARQVPTGTRGLYVLYHCSQPEGKSCYAVVYVGRATKGIKPRLIAHMRKESKGEIWTHFSAFEVWEEISDDVIVELEGLFRHIYRKDSSAMPFNDQRGFKMMNVVRKDNLEEWA